MIRYFSFILPIFCFALPKGEQVMSGQIDIKQADHVCTIKQQSDQALIYWDEFSIGLKEHVRFDQPNSKSAILNQVISDSLSEIHGNLQANGRVYLVNPNGIVIGPEGRIQASRFIASCLDVAEYFADEEMQFTKGNISGALTHQGMIDCTDEVYLIATSIDSIGETKGKMVGLIGAEDVFLKESEGALIWVHIQGEGTVDHSGKIEAIQTSLYQSGGSALSFAVNQSGITDATGVEFVNGKVFLSSEKTTITGSISAPAGEVTVLGDTVHVKDTALLDTSSDKKGGEILIGGDYQGKNPDVPNAKGTYIEPGASILANAYEEGSGGKVILWGDRENWFYGTVSAQGGRLGGDGGFVEVSSPHDLKFHGRVDTTAPLGKIGTLLLDPSDIKVTNATSNPSFPTKPPGTYDPSGTDAILNASDVESALASNDVTISTSAGSGGEGNVVFDTDITWNAATTLTVNADCAITLTNCTISNTKTGGTNFDAINFTANPTSLIGSFKGMSFSGTGTGKTTAHGICLESEAFITSVEGNIFITGVSNGTGDYNQGVSLGDDGKIFSTGTSSDAAKITIDATSGTGVTENHGMVLSSNGYVESVNGDLKITPISRGTGAYNNGIMLEDSSLISSSGKGADAASITINATPGSGSTGNYGVRGDSTSNVTSAAGGINITGGFYIDPQ